MFLSFFFNLIQNTVWFSLGWCTFWMIVSLIFAVKLAKYYRTMKYTKMPKNRVSDMAYQDMPMTSYEDSETGRGNPQDNVIVLNDINSGYIGKILVCLYVCLSVVLSWFLSVCLSVRPSVCLFVNYLFFGFPMSRMFITCLGFFPSLSQDLQPHHLLIYPNIYHLRPMKNVSMILPSCPLTPLLSDRPHCIYTRRYENTHLIVIPGLSRPRVDRF